MYKIGIIGATGFTGSELIRILVHHPSVEISMLSSESMAGKNIAEVHPFLKGIIYHELVNANHLMQNNELDLVFLALPHGVSMEYVKKLEGQPYKLIDLSGDFRLSGPDVYRKWYKKPHIYEKGFEHAVYGIPELYRNQIAQAELVANPGCFPTGALLALAPMVQNRLINEQTIIIDAKTGITGAGVKAQGLNHFSNVNDNFKAYGLKHHRHTIEIEEKINHMGANGSKVQFTPHLLPVDRGILTTIYLTPAQTVNENTLIELYRDFYSPHYFVRITDGQPEIKHVRGSQFCDIHIEFDQRTNIVLITSAIDNLVRGAAGEAIQNMNLMLGINETSGLGQVALMP